jgi:excisionase family DNA binding protein
MLSETDRQVMREPWPGNWLTVQEVSRRVRRCPEVVRRYVREGKLPAHKLGLMWYIRPEDADALAERLDDEK